ncbi:putative ABC transporter permease [Lachnospiraceae bacterium OttesenSCG-928-D06]|nr:putative ABC transporter permease [Lachnospiraceae bacterium OttesenSCG-928-D06]
MGFSKGLISEGGNMWSKEVFGTDVYHLVAGFIMYSIIGWLVESFYMTLCNRRLTNRGFAKSPFCPIYGFGGMIGYLVLSPLKGQYIKLYIVGAILATAFEFLVGKGMLKLFGELWWDYNDKPFNYKGILCLESTLAWGLYANIIVHFLHERVMFMIDHVGAELGIRFVLTILTIVTIDYCIQILHAFHIDLKEKKEAIKEFYNTTKARWY